MALSPEFLELHKESDPWAAAALIFKGFLESTPPNVATKIEKLFVLSQNRRQGYLFQLPQVAWSVVCQGRSKIRPRWRSKTRPSGRGSKFLTAASRGGVRKWEGPCVGGPSCCVRGDSCRR